MYKQEKDSEKRSGEGAVICDLVAVLVAMEPGIVVKSEMVHVEVEGNSKAIGWGATVVDWGHCYDGAERKRMVEWITEIDVEMYARMVEEAMRTYLKNTH